VIARTALRGLLLDSLALWDVAGEVDWLGDELRLQTADGRCTVLWPAAPGQQPARWFLREDNGRTRPTLSISGLLTALRTALSASPAPPRLRVTAGPAVTHRASAAPEAGRIPILVVTGALGSGKTTLIARMLADERYGRTAVIVNEFGAIGLDHALVASSTETLVQLTTGCLCCAVRGDLLDTLLDLDRRRREGEIAFDRVVIETSGLADPTPILQGLLTDRAVAGSFVLRGVLTLVDAVHGPAALAELAEAQRQVALADRILLTKTDVADIAGELRASIAILNPDAMLGEAAHGVVEPDWLFAPGALPQLPALSRFSTAAHTPGISSLVMVPAKPMPGAALALFLQALAEHAGHRLLRAKGLLDVAEQPGCPALVHGVRHIFEPPAWLDHWPGGEARSFLVLIGHSLPPLWPKRLLAAITDEVDDEIASR